MPKPAENCQGGNNQIRMVDMIKEYVWSGSVQSEHITSSNGSLIA
jgi:hypothetical protein